MMNIAVSGHLDATGLRCPLPLLRMKVAVAGMAAGEVLEVLATDPGSQADFESWARISGHELLESSLSDGVYRFLIRKQA